MRLLKCLSLILCFLVIFSNYSYASTTVGGNISEDTLQDLHSDTLKGNVNGDQQIGLDDAIISLQVLTVIEPSVVVYKEGDVNGDGMVGLDDAIFALQYVSGSRQPLLSVLEGTWEGNSLASGPGAPWWERGPVVIDEDGSFSGTLDEYNSDPDTVSGALCISADGIITSADIDPPYFRAVMDAEKTVIVGTSTWVADQPGDTDTGTTEISVWVKK